MAGITLEQAQTQLAQWLGVMDDIATKGQSTAIHGREFTAANLAAVRQEVEYWDRKVKALSSTSAGRARVRGITPVG